MRCTETLAHQRLIEYLLVRRATKEVVLPRHTRIRTPLCQRIVGIENPHAQPKAQYQIELLWGATALQLMFVIKCRHWHRVYARATAQAPLSVCSVNFAGRRAEVSHVQIGRIRAGCHSAEGAGRAMALS